MLTVHGAKGLEFPVAVMAGAPTIVNRSRPAPVLYAEDAQPGTTTEMRLTVDNQTHGFDARASVEKVLDGYERTRLQYVAATRARDYLIVCTHHNDRGTSVGRQTWDLLQEIPDTWTTVELAGDQIFGDDPAQLRLPDDDFVAAQEAWLRQQEQVLDTTNAPIRWSATKVASVLAPDRDYSDPSPKAAQADSEAQGHGPAFGSAVHDALELISFDLIPSVGGSTTDPPATSNDELYKLATATAQLQGVPDLVDQVAARLDQALRSEVVRQAAGSRHWRELAVSLALPGGSFDGIIDLVVETAEGLLIVDYKTDYLRPEAFESDLAEKTARYRYQIAAYALAVERLIGDASVVGGHLLFLDRDGVHDCAVPALEAAKVEVARLLGL